MPQIRERVLRTREIQLNRFAAEGERIYSNAQMGPRQILTYCDLGSESERMLERAMQQRVTEHPRPRPDAEGRPAPSPTSSPAANRRQT